MTFGFESRTADSGNPPLRILVADDHKDFAGCLISLLQTKFDVIGAVENGSLLLETAVKTRPDVIVMDVSMPVMNGIETAHLLRAAGIDSKLIFMSVNAQREVVEACLSTGALGFVSKLRLSAEMEMAISEALSNRTFISPSSSL